MRRCSEPVDAESAHAPEVHLVGVIFENLLFRKLLLKSHGDEHLRELAPPTLVRVEQKLRASCMLSADAPCSFRPFRKSTQAAFIMRKGSKPLCWKKRLSSAEITACTSDGGMSRNFTRRRFSRRRVRDDIPLKLDSHVKLHSHGTIHQGCWRCYQRRRLAAGNHLVYATG